MLSILNIYFWRNKNVLKIIFIIKSHKLYLSQKYYFFQNSPWKDVRWIMSGSRKSQLHGNSEWTFTPISLYCVTSVHRSRRALRLHLITHYVWPTRTHSRAIYRMVMLFTADHLEGETKKSGWTQLDFAARNRRALFVPPVSIFPFPPATGYLAFDRD